MPPVGLKGFGLRFFALIVNFSAGILKLFVSSHIMEVGIFCFVRYSQWII
jgi:hypothetical protein